MSIYMLNLLSYDAANKKSANNLRNMILLGEVTTVPSEVLGAPGCIEFFSSKHMTKITMCLNPEYVEQIIEAYQDFMKCRQGDNLQEINAENFKEIVRAACLGGTLSFKDKERLQKFLGHNGLAPDSNYEKKKKEEEHMEKLGINPAFGLTVPGTR